MWRRKCRWRDASGTILWQSLCQRVWDFVSTYFWFLRTFEALHPYSTPSICSVQLVFTLRNMQQLVSTQKSSTWHLGKIIWSAASFLPPVLAGAFSRSCEDNISVGVLLLFDEFISKTTTITEKKRPYRRGNASILVLKREQSKTKTIWSNKWQLVFSKSLNWYLRKQHLQLKVL